MSSSVESSLVMTKQMYYTDQEENEGFFFNINAGFFL